MSSPTRPSRKRRWLAAGLVVAGVLAAYGGVRVLPTLGELFAPTASERVVASLAPLRTTAPPESARPVETPASSSSAGPPGPTGSPAGLPPMPSLPPGPPAGTAPLRVPILIYHEVIPGADPAAADYQMTPARFDAQLATLADRGWRAITASELASLLATGATPPRRTMVITFDDGTADHWTWALPVLRRLGFPASFYVVSAFVGTPGYLDWDQVRAMRAGGMEIGNHSARHPRLSEIPAEQAAADVAEAQRTIAARLGAAPVTFAYPGGAVNEAAVAAVRAAGLLAAFTTAEGRSYGWADRLTIPRINVGAHWDAARLASILDGYVR